MGKSQPTYTKEFKREAVSLFSLFFIFFDESPVTQLPRLSPPKKRVDLMCETIWEVVGGESK
jgi:hypothetical protein